MSASHDHHHLTHVHHAADHSAGANTGIGKETVRELARNGAKVFMACRSAAKCEAARDDVKASIKGDSDVTTMSLDLASFKSIDAFAAEFNALDLPLHILVNNAGVMKSPGAAFVGKKMTYGWDTTKEGLEYHIGVNHIGHFKLTSLLMGALQKPEASRVVAVSSAAEEGAFEPEGMKFELWEEKGPSYEDGAAYGQSKLANLLFAKELAERMKGTGVTAYSCHPGIIKTDLSRYMEIQFDKESEGNTVAQVFNVLLMGFFNLVQFESPGGALTQLHLATAPPATLTNGGYYVPVGIHTAPKHSKGNDAALQKKLWTETEAVIQRHS